MRGASKSQCGAEFFFCNVFASFESPSASSPGGSAGTRASDAHCQVLVVGLWLTSSLSDVVFGQLVYNQIARARSDQRLLKFIRLEYFYFVALRCFGGYFSKRPQ